MWKSYWKWLEMVDHAKFKWCTNVLERYLVQRWEKPKIHDMDSWTMSTASLLPPERYLRNVDKDRYHRKIRWMVYTFLVEEHIDNDSRKLMYLDIVGVHHLLREELEKCDMSDNVKAWSYSNDTEHRPALHYKVLRIAAKNWMKGMLNVTKEALDEETKNQILLDVKRTLPKHKGFRNNNGCDGLILILSVIAVLYPNVGYCQGMNVIAARCLIIFDFDIALATVFMIQWLSSTTDKGRPIDGNPLWPIARSQWIRKGSAFGDSGRKRPHNVEGVQYLKEVLQYTGMRGPGMGTLSYYYGSGLAGLRMDLDSITKHLTHNQGELMKQLEDMGALEGLTCWLTEPMMTFFSSGKFSDEVIASIWDFLLLWGHLAPGGHEQAYAELVKTVIDLLLEDLEGCNSLDNVNTVFNEKLNEVLSDNRKLLDSICNGVCVNLPSIRRIPEGQWIKLMEQLEEREARYLDIESILLNETSNKRKAIKIAELLQYNCLGDDNVMNPLSAGGLYHKSYSISRRIYNTFSTEKGEAVDRETYES